MYVCAANYGFSIGISDVTPGDNLRRQKDDLVRSAYDESLKLIAKSRAGKLENLPGCNPDQVRKGVCRTKCGWALKLA
jgi:DNA-directed RNA polymerase III subunit RPC1